MRGNHEEEDVYCLADHSKLLGGVNNYILYTKGHKEMPIMLTSE